VTHGGRASRAKLGQGIAILLAFVALDAAAQDVKTWLDRMNTAVEELNYEGTFVRVLDGTAENMRILHRYKDGIVTERITSLDGPGREVVRHGQEVKCVLPERRIVLLESPSGRSSPLSSSLPSYSEALEANYDFANFRKGQVALRDTHIIVIKAKDDYRYGYVLWLDSDTAMPLKSQMRDENGAVVEQILFTNFELRDSIADEALASTVDSDGFRLIGPMSLNSTSSESVHWMASRLPPGFELSAANRSLMSPSRNPVEHLVYSDGLATVSVFIADPKADVIEGHSRFGSTNAYSTSLGGRKITAMGEVPRQTVQRIATSLESTGPSRR
jgi:sigma-E factor negative regulatory protein RseB